ncbi:hypothetical protein TP47_08260 [Xanthomonas citri pv. aurantifolii]|nr:hypothetical protein TP37_03815 [Xanthomonas citri pv. aurantifolii]AMV01759.1 hypothetical protein TP50_04305 [Xanthomonas citri pv. aurantifolii]TBW98588.1 hypothetical protein TP47_08260 [Xanthomonas citri pv. aurantifolii]TBW99816.1 hypothetical protein TP49_03100 [Xanthomonas citri pv. aurantifolii]TBX02576.1 hypothetical protein TP46_15460 [Xanthomonas citri pv. aurantifolii]
MRVLLTIVAWILERLTTGSEQVQALQWYASAAAYERSLPRLRMPGSGHRSRQRTVRTVTLSCRAQQVPCMRKRACNKLVHRPVHKRTASIVSAAASVTEHTSFAPVEPAQTCQRPMR